MQYNGLEIHWFQTNKDGGAKGLGGALLILDCAIFGYSDSYI